MGRGRRLKEKDEGRDRREEKKNNRRMKRVCTVTRGREGQLGRRRRLKERDEGRDRGEEKLIGERGYAERTHCRETNGE